MVSRDDVSAAIAIDIIATVAASIPPIASSRWARWRWMLRLLLTSLPEPLLSNRDAIATAGQKNV